MRTNLHLVPRDNVVFELGMFMGALARNRCFFVVPADRADFHVPSDLAGITAARFDPATAKTNPTASVVGACEAIRRVLSTLHAEGDGLSGEWKHVWTIAGKVGGAVKETTLDCYNLDPRSGATSSGRR